MGIIKGAISFGSNFNIGAKGPIDARMRVETIADLTKEWTADMPAYEGMSVICMEDSNIYVLTAADATVATNWKKIGDASGDITNLQTQITANKTAIDTLNGGDTSTGSVKKTVKDAIEALDVDSSTSEAVKGVSVTVSQKDGMIQQPVVAVVDGSISDTADNKGNLVTGEQVYAAIKDKVESLDASNNVSDAVKGVTVKVDETDGKVSKPVITIADASVEKDNTNLATGGQVYAAIEAKVESLKGTNDASTNGVTITITEEKGIATPGITITPGSIEKDNTNLVTGGAVKDAIDAAVSSVYKVKGCVDSSSNLPTEGLTVGDVYNVRKAFTLDGQKYPAGTNVVWASAETDGESGAHKAEHWDALGGTVDLTGYLNGVVDASDGNVVTGISKDGDSSIKSTKANVGALKITGYSKGKDSSLDSSLADTDTINVALGKLEAGVAAAKASGVTSFDGKTGAVTVQSATADGSVNLAVSERGELSANIVGLDNVIKGKIDELDSSATGTINGYLSVKVAQTDGKITSVTVDSSLKSAALNDASAFATAGQGEKADSAVQSASGTGDDYITVSAGKEEGKTNVAVTAKATDKLTSAVSKANSAMQSASGDDYISAAKGTDSTEVKVAATDALKTAVTNANSAVQSASGDDYISAAKETDSTVVKIAATDALKTAVTNANSAVQSASGDDYISAAKGTDSTEVKVAATDALKTAVTNANNAVQSVSGDDYISASVTEHKVTVSAKTGSVSAGEEKMLATCNDVKTYVDNSIANAMAWAEFA